MKKSISLVLSLLMIISMCSFNVFAEDTFGEIIIEADKTDVKVKDVVTYTVYLGDCEGLGGVYNASFTLSIPEGLTFVDDSGKVDADFDKITGFALSDFRQKTMVFGSMGGRDGYEGGKVKIMTFQCAVNDGATGDLTVTFTKAKLTDAERKSKDPAVTVAEVTVAVPATGVSIKTDEGTTVEVGKTIGLQAVVEPDNSTDKVLWSASNDDGSVSITDLGNGKIDIEGTAVGTVTMTAKAGNQSATCTITVTAATVAVAGVTVDKTLELEVDEEKTLTVEVSPAEASNKKVSFTSDPEGIVTVDESGKVTGVKEGTTTITVTTEDGGKTAECQVTVSPKTIPVTGLTVDPESVALDVEGIAVITASVEPEAASDPTVTWTSADEKVATVVNGTITAVAAGDTTVTAKAGNVEKIITVHVHNYTEWVMDADGHQQKCSSDDTVTGSKEEHKFTYTQTETTHNGICSVCGYTTVDVEHTFGEWETVTPATEDAAGLRKHTCTVCDYVATEVIPQLPHEHDLQFVAEVPADCENPGTKAHYICKKDASELFLDDKGQNAVTAEDLVIQALGHDYIKDEANSKAPTCTEAGYTHYVCSHDNTHTKDEPIDTIAHDYQEVSRTPASCTEDGSVVSECTMCHEKITATLPATGHTWGEWVVDKEATEDEEGEQHHECTVCHEIEKQVIPKKGQTPIYVGPYVAPVYNPFAYLDIFPWINNPYVPTQPTTAPAPEPAAPAPTEPVEVTPSVYGPTGQVVDWHSPFTDVTTENEYYEAIGYVYGENLFLGKTEDFFGVNDPMTRGMFVTVLGRLANVNVSKYTGTSFSDVDVEMYYAPYIEWAAANNIVLGMGDETFEPETNVTVEQAVAIIARYARFANAYNPSSFDLSGYADFEQIDDWALSDMSWAAFTGVYTGKDGKLTPVDEATRGIVASMLWKYAK